MAFPTDPSKLEETRRKMREASQRRWERPEERERARQSALRQFADPAARERARQSAIKQFSDPGMRQKMREAHAHGRERRVELVPVEIATIAPAQTIIEPTVTMTTRQAAQRLGVQIDSVNRMIRRGALSRPPTVAEVEQMLARGVKHPKPRRPAVQRLSMQEEVQPRPSTLTPAQRQQRRELIAKCARNPQRRAARKRVRRADLGIAAELTLDRDWPRSSRTHLDLREIDEQRERREERPSDFGVEAFDALLDRLG